MAQTPNTTSLGINQWAPGDLITPGQLTEDNRLITDGVNSALGSGGIVTSNAEASSIAARTVVAENFIRKLGSRVFVKFTSAVNQANPTLNVNNTGAAPINVRGAAVQEASVMTTIAKIPAGHMAEFLWDGSAWELLNPVEGIGNGHNIRITGGSQSSGVGNGVNNSVDGGMFNATGNGSGNAIIGGGISNGVGNGSNNKISGGGSHNGVGNGSGNSIDTDGNFNGIGNGYNNSIQSGSYNGIGNGSTNTISGGEHNGIGNGSNNSIAGNGSYNGIGNGSNNTIAAGHSNGIGNGYSNSIDSGNYNGVGNGYQNRVVGMGSNNGVGNGRMNYIESGSNNGVGNGTNNRVRTGDLHGIGNGANNLIESGTRNSIGSGSDNRIIGDSYNSIGSGSQNFILRGSYNSIGNGNSNEITAGILSGGIHNVIGGGNFNAIGNDSSGDLSFNALYASAYARISHNHTMLLTPNNDSVTRVSNGDSQIRLGFSAITPVANAALTVISDGRDKFDQKPLQYNALEFINALAPKQYQVDCREDYHRWEEIDEEELNKLRKSDPYSAAHDIINVQVHQIDGTDIEWIDNDAITRNNEPETKDGKSNPYATRYSKKREKRRRMGTSQEESISEWKKTRKPYNKSERRTKIKEEVEKIYEAQLKSADDESIIGINKEIESEVANKLIIDESAFENADPQIIDYTCYFKQVPLERDGRYRGSRYHNGFIAQEVQKAASDMGFDFAGVKHFAHNIDDDKESPTYGQQLGDDIYALQYEQLIAPLVGAVQALTKRVQELEARK